MSSLSLNYFLIGIHLINRVTTNLKQSRSRTLTHVNVIEKMYKAFEFSTSLVQVLSSLQLMLLPVKNRLWSFCKKGKISSSEEP